MKKVFTGPIEGGKLSNLSGRKVAGKVGAEARSIDNEREIY